MTLSVPPEEIPGLSSAPPEGVPGLPVCTSKACSRSPVCTSRGCYGLLSPYVYNSIRNMDLDIGNKDPATNNFREIVSSIKHPCTKSERESAGILGLQISF